MFVDDDGAARAVREADGPARPERLDHWPADGDAHSGIDNASCAAQMDYVEHWPTWSPSWAARSPTATCTPRGAQRSHMRQTAHAVYRRVMRSVWERPTSMRVYAEDVVVLALTVATLVALTLTLDYVVSLWRY